MIREKNKRGTSTEMAKEMKIRKIELYNKIFKTILLNMGRGNITLQL